MPHCGLWYISEASDTLREDKIPFNTFTKVPLIFIISVKMKLKKTVLILTEPSRNEYNRNVGI